MGKYDDSKHAERDRDDVKIFFLKYIANELAEANRLTREKLNRDDWYTELEDEC